MPIFWFLVVLAGALFWLICAFAFKPVGAFFSKLVNNAKSAMEESEEEKKNEKESDENDK